jgi:hypothetical protein
MAAVMFLKRTVDSYSNKANAVSNPDSDGLTINFDAFFGT